MGGKGNKGGYTPMDMQNKLQGESLLVFFFSTLLLNIIS